MGRPRIRLAYTRQVPRSTANMRRRQAADFMTWIHDTLMYVAV